mmetsp:Transcript_5814/g.10453  ORF Transcript_5814/g.10453 Transcript_5814/m.10453 type:complete len:216 (-) Transcript_5814:2022-2669(-)
MSGPVGQRHRLHPFILLVHQLLHAQRECLPVCGSTWCGAAQCPVMPLAHKDEGLPRVIPHTLQAKGTTPHVITPHQHQRPVRVLTHNLWPALLQPSKVGHRIEGRPFLKASDGVPFQAKLGRGDSHDVHAHLVQQRGPVPATRPDLQQRLVTSKHSNGFVVGHTARILVAQARPLLTNGAQIGHLNRIGQRPLRDQPTPPYTHLRQVACQVGVVP